jgi:GTPase SAR1 family protein
MDDLKAAIDLKNNQLPKVLGSIHEVTKELRRSKIMIVGEGCAGKTAFANSIIGEKYEETESTVGINAFMCSVTHAALSNSEWKKCEKIEKEYENAIAEHLSFKKDDLAQPESRQIVGKKDKNGLDTRKTGLWNALKSEDSAAEHQGGKVDANFAHRKGDKREGDGVALDHLKGGSTTDDIDQSSNAKVDEDMIVKYLASNVKIGDNILINIFDYGGQPVFNVSVMFIYYCIC